MLYSIQRLEYQLRKFVLFLIFTFYSAFSYSSSCYVSNDDLKKWSGKYKDLINITVDEYGSDFFVTVSFPIEVDDKNFHGALLLKGKNWDKPEFLIPLATTNQGDKVFVSYSINSSLIADSYVTGSYGAECGIEVIYPIEYNKAIKSDS